MEYEINIGYPVEEKYIAPAYYLGWVSEKCAKLLSANELSDTWEIEIEDNEGQHLGEFSIPKSWIKYKELKVLTAEESWQKVKNFAIQEFTGPKQNYEIGFEDGEQNGQLKLWLKMKAIINKFKSTQPNYEVGEMIKSFENIKPLGDE